MVQFDRNGETGNIFWIMGQASHELKERGKACKADEMFKRVVNSDSYQEALKIIGEYVELVEV